MCSSLDSSKTEFDPEMAFSMPTDPLVLGPHVDALRAFASTHPQVRITTGHMWLDFFEANQKETG
jgi:hypothetical protein